MTDQEDVLTGVKVYARDFKKPSDLGSLDMDLFELRSDCLRALFLRATHPGWIFEGIDIALLQSSGVKSCYIKKQSAGGSAQLFDDLLGSNQVRIVDPKDDLLLSMGNPVKYAGQPACLLLFDSLASFLDAQREKDYLSSAIAYCPPPSGTEQPNHLDDILDHYWNIFQYDDWPREDDQKVNWSEVGFSTGKKIDGKKLVGAGTFNKDALDYLSSTDDKVFSFTTTSDAVDVAYLEPDSSLGIVETRSGDTSLVRMLVPTQSHYQDQRLLTKYNPILDHEFEIVPCRLGGGFGGRSSSPFPFYAALAAISGCGKPVKLEFDRLEQFSTGIKRHPSRIETSVAVGNNGQLEAIDVKLLLDGGSVKNLSNSVVKLSLHSAGGGYRISRTSTRGAALRNTGALSGSMRGFGIPQALFNIEQQIDRISAHLGQDPITFRRQIALKTGDSDIDGKRLFHSLKNDEVLKCAQNTKHWIDRSLRKSNYAKEHKTSGRIFGTGMAFAMEAYGTSKDRPSASIKVNDQLEIEVDTFAVEMGQGAVKGIEEYLSREFQGQSIKVNPGKGHLLATRLTKPGESLLGFMDTNAATKATFGTIHVLKNLIDIWKEQVWIPVISKLIDVDEHKVTSEDIHFRQDGFISVGDYEPVSFKEAAIRVSKSEQACIYGLGTFRNSWAYGEFKFTEHGKADPRWLERVAFSSNSNEPTKIDHVEAIHVIDPLKFTPENTPYRSLYASGACLVDLSISKQGSVSLEHISFVLDAGHRISDERVKGQVVGGITQAIGHTLLESYPSGALGGQPRINFDHYALPRVRHMPRQGIDTHFVDVGDNETILNHVPDPYEGAPSPKIDPPLEVYKGIAEIAISPVAPAIANAIIDAIYTSPPAAFDKRFRNWPITREEILERMAGQP